MYVTPSKRLKPGHVLEQSGVYRVYHHAHRLPHSVYIPSGLALPQCRRCGDRVEFGLLMPCDQVERDHDLFRFSKAVGS